MIKIPTTGDKGWPGWGTQCQQKKHHNGVMGRGYRRGEGGAANMVTVGKSVVQILQ